MKLRVSPELHYNFDLLEICIKSGNYLFLFYYFIFLGRRGFRFLLVSFVIKVF